MGKTPEENSGRRSHHREDLPRDPGSIVRSQEHDSMRDVFRAPHPAHGDALHESLLTRRTPAFPLRLVIRAGAQEPGRNGVHRDAEWTEFGRKLAHQTKLTVLGGRVALNTGEARGNRCAT